MPSGQGITLYRCSAFWKTSVAGNGATTVSVPHGLGVVPAIVIIQAQGIAGYNTNYALGTSTDTNICFTGVSGQYYDILAFAAE